MDARSAVGASRTNLPTVEHLDDGAWRYTSLAVTTRHIENLSSPEGRQPDAGNVSVNFNARVSWLFLTVRVFRASVFPRPPRGMLRIDPDPEGPQATLGGVPMERGESRQGVGWRKTAYPRSILFCFGLNIRLVELFVALDVREPIDFEYMPGIKWVIVHCDEGQVSVVDILEFYKHEPGKK